MSPGPLPIKIALSARERSDLEAITRKATSPPTRRASSTNHPHAAAGCTNAAIAGDLQRMRKTLRKWRGRYAEAGHAGLRDAPRSWCPPTCTDTVRAIIIALACELPATRDLPLSRMSTDDIHAEAARELDPCPLPSTIAAWLAPAAIRPLDV